MAPPPPPPSGAGDGPAAATGLEANGTDDANNDRLVRSDNPDHPANLIPSLCAKFWTLGWVTGTGGGCSIREESVSAAPPFARRIYAVDGPIDRRRQ